MDLYFVLGVERAASLDEIKRAYKRLARRYHPDINPGDREAEVQFRRIATAFETLSDPVRRQRYDTQGHVVGEATGAVAFGFEGFDFSVSVSGSAAPTFGDLFAEVLQEQSGVGRPERGADLHQTVSLTLEEAFAGGVRDVVVMRQAACRACAGSGDVQDVERSCAQCAGTGVIRSARGHMVFSRSCPVCRGSGRLNRARCAGCGGRQIETRSESVRVQIPPGVGDGDRIVVAGRGHAGRSGGTPGDLHLTMAVAPHPTFRREGDDLHLTVGIAIHEAALGARVPVASIDGEPARLRVLPGTQSGQRFRVRERGMVSTRTGKRGDLVIEVRLMLPAVLDERSKDLLREFGRINARDARI